MIGTEIAFRLGPGSVARARAIAAHLAALAPAAAEHVLFCDAEAGEYGCLAVWRTPEDAAAYMALPEVDVQVAELAELMGTPTRVRRYEMEYQRGPGGTR
jgi:hypothetical protein